MRPEDYLGCAYVAGARGPRAFDCLGLFLSVQREVFGRELPDPHVPPWRGHGPARGVLERRAVPTNAIGAGDALLFRVSRDLLHVATAISARDMIHTQQGFGVVIAPIKCPLWRGRFIGAYRFDT